MEYLIGKFTPICIIKSFRVVAVVVTIISSASWTAVISLRSKGVTEDRAWCWFYHTYPGYYKPDTK